MKTRLEVKEMQSAGALTISNTCHVDYEKYFSFLTETKTRSQTRGRATNHERPFAHAPKTFTYSPVVSESKE